MTAAVKRKSAVVAIVMYDRHFTLAFVTWRCYNQSCFGEFLALSA